MHVRSAAASVARVRAFKGALLTAAVVAALIAAPATTLAAKGGNGGGQSATIAFAQDGSAKSADWPTAGSQVSFAITANVKASDTYKLWVANWCYVNGVAVSAEFQPVSNGNAGAFTATTAGASCTAYVFVYPDTGSPLSGGSMTYNVS